MEMRMEFLPIFIGISVMEIGIFRVVSKTFLNGSSFLEMEHFAQFRGMC